MQNPKPPSPPSKYMIYPLSFGTLLLGLFQKGVINQPLNIGRIMIDERSWFSKGMECVCDQILWEKWEAVPPDDVIAELLGVDTGDGSK